MQLLFEDVLGKLIDVGEMGARLPRQLFVRHVALKYCRVLGVRPAHSVITVDDPTAPNTIMTKMLDPQANPNDAAASAVPDVLMMAASFARPPPQRGQRTLRVGHISKHDSVDPMIVRALRCNEVCYVVDRSRDKRKVFCEADGAVGWVPAHHLDHLPHGLMKAKRHIPVTRRDEGVDVL